MGSNFSVTLLLLLLLLHYCPCFLFVLYRKKTFKYVFYFSIMHVRTDQIRFHKKEFHQILMRSHLSVYIFPPHEISSYWSVITVSYLLFNPRLYFPTIVGCHCSNSRQKPTPDQKGNEQRYYTAGELFLCHRVRLINMCAIQGVATHCL